MLLTEALAKLKLTGNKMDDTVREMSHYTVRPEQIVDPLAKNGKTSHQFVLECIQSVRDQAEYLVKLHSAVARTNRTTKVTFADMTMTIEDALTWRREVAPKLVNMYNGMLTQARNTRNAKPQYNAGAQMQEVKFVVEFNEEDAMLNLKAINERLGALDMALSIVNATTTVIVD